MQASVKIAASGVVSALGRGLAANYAGLMAGLAAAPHRTIETQLETVSAPYQAVAGGPQQAEQRIHWLLDLAIDELLGQHPLTTAARAEIPVFIGSSSYGISLAEEIYSHQLASAPDVAVPIPLDGFTQISQHLRDRHQFTGQDFAFNTACTASANALLSAAESVSSGAANSALVVGIEPFNLTTVLGFHGMQLMSQSVMRPFDLRRDGLVLGECCAALLLTASESDAGVTLCGGSSNCDTYSITASNPDGSTIANVMAQALQNCHLTADQIFAIKAHGTATPLNDDAETASMRRLFPQVPPFFSVKGGVGHTLGGCGALETALVATCLHNATLPASGGFEQPDTNLGLEPLSQPLAVASGYYLLNFFGFGGNNCSLVLHYH